MSKLTKIACGIVYRDSPNGRETLLIKRNAEGGYGYRWEFPKGHVDEGETVETALEREIYEETNLKIDSDYDLLEVNRLHQPGGDIVEMHIYSCKVSGNQTAKISHEHIDLEWTTTTIGFGILPYFERLITKVLDNTYVVESYLDYLQEAKRASRHKVSRNTKIKRATSQMSTSMARKRNDSLYKRMIFYREKYYYYREMIRKKYSARNRSRARK